MIYIWYLGLGITDVHVCVLLRTAYWNNLGFIKKHPQEWPLRPWGEDNHRIRWRMFAERRWGLRRVAVWSPLHGLSWGSLLTRMARVCLIGSFSRFAYSSTQLFAVLNFSLRLWHLKDADSRPAVHIWHGQDMHHFQVPLSKGTIGLIGGPVWWFWGPSSSSPII